MSKPAWPSAMVAWIKQLVDDAVATIVAAIEEDRAPPPPAPPAQLDGPLWATLDETAERLGLGRSKVYDLIRTGHLVSITAGRRRLVSRESVERFRGTEPPA